MAYTTESFIKKAKEVHGNKYDYSNVVYKGCSKKVCIICPKHGKFWQRLYDHLKGHGCPKCGIDMRSQKYALTTEEFVNKATKFHKGKYTYENAVYVNCQTPLWITCPIHGDFSQTPSVHLRGSGCPKCGLSFRISENRFFDFLKTFLPNIEIVREYRDKQVLGRFHLDFYLPEYQIGIEYQGAQHFKPIKLFGGKNAFKKNYERDRVKFKLCNEHGIKMFYFTYETKSVHKDYFAKVYTDEDELKRDVLAYIEEQSLQSQTPINHSFNWMANFACFEPKDTDLSENR